MTKIVFPPETEQLARLLYRVNEALARLTSAAAASTSLRQLHAYERRLNVANRPLEQEARTIRQLGPAPVNKLNRGARNAAEPRAGAL